MMNNRKWLFYFCAGIIFIDIFYLSSAGVYHIMLASGMDAVSPLFPIFWTIISMYSLFYYEKHSKQFTKTEPGIMQPSPFTQKLIFESQMDELKADLKLYLSVYEKQGKDFTEKDLEDFKQFREMLRDMPREL